MKKLSTKTYGSGSLFTIKPLEWRGNIQDWCERYEASVPMGTFHVERIKKDLDTAQNWGDWKWGYCFDEYYDENQLLCESLEEGKLLAEEEWERRILPALNCVNLAQVNDYDLNFYDYMAPPSIKSS